MKTSQREKAEAFRALHERAGAFVIANVWDGFSARIAEGLGFEALATSSAAAACLVGKADGAMTREESLEQAKEMADATRLPVSGDLENGFGHTPEAVAETVRRAAEAGLAGCTIEDSTGDEAKPLYETELAVERIAAGVEAARGLGFPFVLTARAHALLYDPGKVKETIERLQAFEKVGADVLFAPGLADLGAVREACAAVKRPVNFMAGIPGKSFSVRELEEAGVKRISLATSLFRAAMGELVRVGRGVRERGDLGFIDGLGNTSEILELVKR